MSPAQNHVNFTGNTTQLVKGGRQLKTHLATALAILLLLFAAVAPPAQAVLQRVGPINPANGYPAWYQDTTGLALEHCLPQSQAEQVWCLLPPIPNGLAP
ncbi:MAG TPA: hypothetical protein VLM91_04405, partial [Candidatus Methylomirabilis sp.]|nr:hypothetical protein [Candidatus Methylomirabilis sp.]